MFLRTVRSKGHDYLLLVENVRQDGRHKQRVIRYFGRRDRVDMEAVQSFVRQVRQGFGASNPEGHVPGRG